MAGTNPNSRLEAFCDGVFAIALTLLIIDIKIPPTESIGSTADLWRALRHLAPSVSAFLLSFTVILITWVNHHAAMALVDKSSSPFIYANGLLLLTVVFVPFPTAMAGEYLFTDHAAPAVVLYDSVLAAQAIAWVLLAQAAIAGRLTTSDHAARTMRHNLRSGYFAFVLYALCAVVALWFPMSMAIVTAATWVFWLIWGIQIKIKHDER
jgi:uncharacterized membrane protein